MAKSNGEQSSSRSEEEPYSMTEEELSNRLNKPTTGRFFVQFYAVATGAACFGIMLGSSAPIMRLYGQKYEFHNDFISQHIDVASISFLGMSFGSLLLSAMAVRSGPRKILLITSPIQCTLWLLIAFKIESRFQIFLLFFSGFFSVGYVTCGQKLLKDYVPTNTYFFYFAIFRSSEAFGIFISYAFISETSAFVSVAFLAAEFFFLFFCPESPVFLYSKGPAQAEAALKFLRGPTHINQDMRQIKKDIENLSFDVSAKYMLFYKVVYKAILINLALIIFRSLTGYYVFIAYSLALLDIKNKPFDKIDYFGKFEDNVVIGFTYFFTKALSTVLHYKFDFGTKRPLIISLSLVSACLFLFAINFLLTNFKILFFLQHQWTKLVILILHTISYEVGISVVPEFLLFDYLPSQVFPFVKLVLECVQWFIIYMTVRFLVYDEHFNHAASFCLAGVGTLCGCFFSWKLVVDSKGKPLLQIQQELGGNPIGTRSIYTSRHKYKRHPLYHQEHS